MTLKELTNLLVTATDEQDVASRLRLEDVAANALMAAADGEEPLQECLSGALEAAGYEFTECLARQALCKICRGDGGQTEEDWIPCECTLPLGWPRRGIYSS